MNQNLIVRIAVAEGDGGGRGSETPSFEKRASLHLLGGYGRLSAWSCWAKADNKRASVITVGEKIEVERAALDTPDRLRFPHADIPSFTHR